MTDLEAANKALALIGVAPVGALADDTIAARTVNRMLPTVISAVLSEFAWEFALRLDPLVRSARPAPPGFSYTFTPPGDMENLIQVYRGHVSLEDGRRLKTHLEKLYFIVQDGIICTNELECSIEYTFKNNRIDTWSDAAVEALVTRLAADIAPTLAGGQQTGMGLYQKYQLLIMNARARSLQTEHIAPMRDTHYIDSRWW